MNRQAKASTRIEPIALLCFCLLGFAGRTNAQTGFNIQSVQQNTNGSVTLTWPVVQPTGTYFVAYANSSAGPWQVFTNGTVTAQPFESVLFYTDFNAATVSQRFYKIELGRAPVSMSLVLSRDGDGNLPGGPYLPGAVTDFMNDFSDNYDQAGMVSYATTATADVPLSNVFRTAISTAAGNLVYIGGTFSIGGLVLASNQLAYASNLPGLKAIKVAVFFADDLPNMIEQNLNCPPPTPWIIGGYDTGNYVGFWPTNTANQSMPYCALSNGGNPSCCGGQNYFVTASGAHEPLLRSNVTMEAESEAISLAQSMQANGWYVYCLGLSEEGALAMNTNFLYEVANDPRSSTYNANLPAGITLIITNPADLDQAFESIAAQMPVY